MIIKVKYMDKHTNFYSGKEYTYRTDLALTPLMKVLAPAGDPPEIKRAIVTQVNLPESTISQEWADRVQKITEVDKS